MKNIFISPTDEASRLYEIGGELTLSVANTKHKYNTGRNVYITIEEKLENKNYVLSSSSIGALYLDGIINTVEMLDEEQWKKVILTNDPKLIADGVQELTEEQLKEIVSKYPLAYIEVSRIKDIREDAWYNTALCKTVYSLSFSAEKEVTLDDIIGKEMLSKADVILTIHKGKELKTEEVMEGRISAYNFLDFNDSPEKETLEKIKFVLSANNESQAIRFIEQYGEWVKENCRKEFKT